MCGSCANYVGVKTNRLMNSRAKPGEAYVPTSVEHLANTVTHGICILPSFIGLTWMLYLATDALQYTIALVYGVSTVSLFTVSTTFHTLSYTGYFRNIREFFHIGDRAVIYIFIASSYTPWLLLRHYEDGSHGTFMTWVVWTCAAIGILYQYTFHEQYKWLELLLYLIIGVCPSISILRMTSFEGLSEMAFGGVVYLCGVIFFKSDGRIPFAHAIWHCFVFVGAVTHFWAVCKYLLGAHNTASIMDANGRPYSEYNNT